MAALQTGGCQLSPGQTRQLPAVLPAAGYSDGFSVQRRDGVHGRDFTLYYILRTTWPHPIRITSVVLGQHSRGGHPPLSRLCGKAVLLGPTWSTPLPDRPRSALTQTTPRPAAHATLRFLSGCQARAQALPLEWHPRQPWLAAADARGRVQVGQGAGGAGRGGSGIGPAEGHAQLGRAALRVLGGVGSVGYKGDCGADRQDGIAGCRQAAQKGAGAPGRRVGAGLLVLKAPPAGGIRPEVRASVVV